MRIEQYNKAEKLIKEANSLVKTYDEEILRLKEAHIKGNCTDEWLGQKMDETHKRFKSHYDPIVKEFDEL